MKTALLWSALAVNLFAAQPILVRITPDTLARRLRARPRAAHPTAPSSGPAWQRGRGGGWWGRAGGSCKEGSRNGAKNQSQRGVRRIIGGRRRACRLWHWRIRQALWTRRVWHLPGLRDRALLSAAYDTGLRASELVAVAIEHIEEAIDPEARLLTRSIEGSNVTATSALVEMIEASRSWDTQLKMIGDVRDMDSATADLMQLPR